MPRALAPSDVHGNVLATDYLTEKSQAARCDDVSSMGDSANLECVHTYIVIYENMVMTGISIADEVLMKAS